MTISQLIPCDAECNRRYYSEGITVCFGDLSAEAQDRYLSFLGIDIDYDTPIAGDLVSFIHEGYIAKEE